MFSCVLPCVSVHDGQESELRPKYRGLLHATRTIVKQESFWGLYRVNIAITAYAFSAAQLFVLIWPCTHRYW